MALAAFVQELLQRGARRVYATARHPKSIGIPGAIALPLDITDSKQVAEVAQIASDTNLLINNAGVTTFANAITGALDDIRLEMETNYFGTLVMRCLSRKLSPRLMRPLIEMARWSQAAPG